MKITAIKLYVVNVPERHWWWSDDEHGQPLHQRAEHGVVEVETDEGLVGLAQIERFTAMEVLEAQFGQWLGTDVLGVNLAQPREVMGHSFEQMILDLRGQALGVPIWQLLGGRVRDRIESTQCTGYKTPEHTAEDAQWGWERGFRTYKMKCITDRQKTAEERIRYVVDRIEAIHRVLPDMAVRPDIRWRLEEVWAAQEMARRLEGHKMDSLESPIAKGAAGGTYSEWRRLRQTIQIPIGDHVGGSEDMIRRFEAEALDYAIIGGTAFEAIYLSHLAQQLGMGGWSQTVSYGPGAAMGLHVAACMPHLNKPYDMVGPMAWEHMLTNEDFPFEEGALLVPERPGLGYTLDHDAVKQYLVEEREFKKD